MGLLTNAGDSERLSPAARAAITAEDVSQGVMQDAETRAKGRAQRRERSRLEILQLESQQKVQVGDGEDAQLFDGVTLDYQLDEPVYDMSVPTLAPFVVRWEECPWWPPTFSGGGTRHPLKPVLGPDAWEAIMDGVYCMRCLVRHDQPHPAACASCRLTAEHRERALDYVEAKHKLMQSPGPNRAQRRANQRAAKAAGMPVASREKRTPGGLVVPGWG